MVAGVDAGIYSGPGLGARQFGSGLGLGFGSWGLGTRHRRPETRTLPLRGRGRILVGSVGPLRRAPPRLRRPNPNPNTSTT